MSQQTPSEARQSAEEAIFALRKKIDSYAAAGDGAEVYRLQLKISELQRKHGAMTGIGKDESDERSA